MRLPRWRPSPISEKQSTSAAKPNLQKLYSTDSTAFVRTLAASHDIAPKHQAELRRKLLFAATIYIAYRDAELEKRDVTAARERLVKLRNQSDALQKALAALSENDLHRLRELNSLSEDEAAGVCRSGGPGTHDRTRLGHRFHRLEMEAGAYHVRMLDVDDLIEAPLVLSNYAQQILARISRRKGGRPRADALHIWMVNIRNFWTDVLGRDFIFSTSRKRNHMAAYAFCADALKPLRSVEPITAKEMETAMRWAIRGKRPRPSGRHRRVLPLPRMRSAD